MPRQKNDQKLEMFGEKPERAKKIKMDDVVEEIKTSGKKLKFWFILVPILLITLGAILSGGYYYWQFEKLKNNPEAAKTQETDDLLRKIGELIELPSDENPSIATVSDKEKLKEQNFFKKSENGDKVLIYVQAEKAILYRPSVNKIIEVAPVYMNKDKQKEEIAPKDSAGINSESTEPNQDAKNVEDVANVQGVENTQEEKVRVALFNGTTVSGLTKKAEKILNEKMAQAEIIAKENAKRDDYGETIVIDLSGNKQKEAQQIAEIFGAKIGEMPEGEESDAEILVILAN